MQESSADKYKHFFGFREMPFSPAVSHNPKFIYHSDKYATSLATLASSVDKNVPLTLVLGADGVGKTTFINYACKHELLDSNIGLANGQLKSAHELYRQTLASFGYEVKYLGTKEMLQQLQDFLAVEFEKHNGQASILIIDDAHNMYLDALKGLEQLLELNGENDQLLQLVLVGQPELEDLLNVLELEGLSRPGRTAFWLEALSAEETQDYINHRLHLVGAVDKKLFDEQVCLAIYEYSEGLPRKINTICDEALLRSCAQNKYQISTALIHDAANDAQHKAPLLHGSTRLKLRVRVIPDNKKGATYSITGLIIAGITVVLIGLWVGFFSTLTTGENEVPDELKKSPLEVQPGEQMVDPEQSNQLAEHSKNQVKKPVLVSHSLRDETANLMVIEQQLAAAAGHVNALRLTIPDGNNALDIYRSILDKDPHNVKANQGIKRIAKKYVDLSESEHRAGSLDKAEHYLEEAMALDPGLEADPELLVQIDNIRNQNKTTKRQYQDDSNQLVSSTDEEKVVKLLATAERQFSALKLKFPEQDNAFETYTSILSIIPNEQRALNGLQRIVSYYLKKAQKLRSEGNLDKSKLFINRGLRVSPDHQQLTAFKQQINADMENASEFNKIQSFINQADKQIADSNLIHPQSNNAYQTCLDILAIDSSNQLAIQRIGEIQRQLQSQISTVMEKRNFRTALKVANNVLLISSSSDNNSFLNEVAYDAIEAKKIINHQLDSVLVLAEKQLKTEHYAQPAGDNAFESYNKVLEIDPANEDAIIGLGTLKIEYQLLIKTALSNGNIGQALAVAKEGLTVFPDNLEIKSLRDNALAHQEAVVKEERASSKKKKADTEDIRLKNFGTF
ncbi:MAG: AAA family ATPase [Methylococcales bacterium]